MHGCLENHQINSKNNFIDEIKNPNAVFMTFDG